MAIPQGFRNVLGIATPVCGLVRNDRGVPKQTDKSEFKNSTGMAGAVKNQISKYALMVSHTAAASLRVGISQNTRSSGSVPEKRMTTQPPLLK